MEKLSRQKYFTLDLLMYILYRLQAKLTNSIYGVNFNITDRCNLKYYNKICCMKPSNFVLDLR